MEQVSGPTIPLIASGSSARFTAPTKIGTLQFRLAVSDGSPDTVSDTVTVRVSNTLPVSMSTPGASSASFTAFVGTAPAAASIGLLVTGRAVDGAALATALATAGCNVESLAVIVGGAFKAYIPGAPAVVNAAFPTSLAAITPFFVRCR